ncbi:hypothetical protein PN419_00575 [Halorubrum ezzemoulense]|uniref:hypothetical protein n=1 Tax=Halorubrum ezzemoulense TaxID=337243 RepID=UPI00232D7085|nr:hypothetical protein [Halorubrum ezzemoulense]MDB9247502.1 hypothetical protein [Halorubrum ezzemoulense]MDB9258589.1 hypothetical protein [Halorubrum ezzemoulense]MDB9264552.1 hypothetical protein [Halorubrum ezzemoulense]MDB9268950.1 hypothetical protein [Halorubrum ezzemoulense]MDB9271520.1 hypothetical protein [Halorubrum ezzemoulense]
MNVTEPPSRFVDESDGQPIEEVNPVGSRYETVAVKRLDDGIEIRAIEHGTEEVNEYQASLTEQLFQGVSIDGKGRRNIDDDIQDILHLLGFTLVDDSVKTY